MNEQTKKASKVLGKGLAHVQDAVDRVFAWGFGKLKDSSKDPEKEENQVIKAGKKVGGFIGDAGVEYYDEYEKLKKARDDKKESS